MILADTSIWIDHFHKTDAILVRLLEQTDVLGHPWVAGELAMGQLRNRHEVLALFDALPRAETATSSEMRAFIEQHALHGKGLSYVDAQLLASTRLTPECTLWTRDKRLTAAARELGCAATI